MFYFFFLYWSSPSSFCMLFRLKWNMFQQGGTWKTAKKCKMQKGDPGYFGLIKGGSGGLTSFLCWAGGMGCWNYFWWGLYPFNLPWVLSINLYANTFLFGDFNIDHKNWLTYSGGTDRPRELCFNFCILNNLTQLVNFPSWIPDCFFVV